MTDDTNIDHASRDHAQFSPSSMSRIINCPVSSYLESDIPESETTKAASEGTLAHEVAEIYLEAELTGKKYPRIGEEYNPEMRRCARRYAKYIHSVLEPYLHLDHHWVIEKKLVVDKDRDIWGTCDFIFIYRDLKGNKHVILFDYKYGIWAVDPKRNWQAATYLYGAREEFEGDGCLEDAEFYIFQPRIAKELKTYSPEPWSIDYDELYENYFSVIDSAIELIQEWLFAEEVSDEDMARYQRTGSHCHFCKAKGICRPYKEAKSGPALSAFKRASMKLSKKELGSGDALTNAGVLSLEELAFIALHAPDIKKFVEAAARMPVHMIKKGAAVPGVKLIPVNPRRYFIDDQKKLVAGLKALGITNPTTTVEKVITLTDVEKQLGKGKVDTLIKKAVEKSYKLVAEDHKVPAAMFGLETSLLFKAAAKRAKK